MNKEEAKGLYEASLQEHTRASDQLMRNVERLVSIIIREPFPDAAALVCESFESSQVFLGGCLRIRRIERENGELLFDADQEEHPAVEEADYYLDWLITLAPDDYDAVENQLSLVP